ncbi:MAG TPA: hypothetical protein VES65_07130 [Solirubrobacteraceae bacterium]|nr:hypothetical protein [Solirubrobacteraceae bacterium]
MSILLLRRLACACTVAALALACAGPPVAVAAAAGGGNAFNELTEGGKEEETALKTKELKKTASTATTGSTSSGSNSSTSSVLLLGLGAAGALLVGIALVILRDARRVAPVGDGPVMGGRSGRDPAVTLRKRRAKAKAARRQRKRNR